MRSQAKEEEEERTFGQKKRRSLKMCLRISAAALFVLTVLMIVNVRKIQGNARVINYAGMVRGGTQKIVKEELYGQPNDEMILQMDTLLDALTNGSEKYHLTKIEDAPYQQSLSQQRTEWDSLKQEINACRLDKGQMDALYQMSEDYFMTADATVSKAQNYAENVEHVFNILEWIIIAIGAVNLTIGVLLFTELRKATMHNKKLDEIANVDSCTGIASKRKCEERLADQRPIPSDSVIACFMFDLNHLKKMNDTYGHEYGDMLIRGFADALKQAALPHMFIGRNGGDEFIAVTVNADPKDLTKFQQRLHEICENTKVAEQAISYASGLAVSSEYPGVTIAAVMAHADERMYENKKIMKAQRKE